MERLRPAVGETNLDDVEAPGAEGTSAASTARSVGSAGGSSTPPRRHSTGMPITRNTTSADVGFPGRPNTGIPSHSARSVGLPGLSARP